MNLNPSRSDWFFPIEEAPVLVTVTHKGVARDVRVPHKKALIAADTGHIVGIVGAGYKVFTNEQAVTLCHKFCLEAFPDTTPAEWTFVEGHGPGTRSWAAMDIHHRSHAINLMGISGGPSEIFTPFVRIMNSYNGSRALRIDVGFLREHCSNGVIFEQEAATLTVPHTRQGIHSLKVARPFAGMAALSEEFRKTLAAVRSVGITPEEGRTLVRQVTGWPQLPEKPSPWESDEQAKLDADLETRLSGYFQELGANAYAAFNTMTDIASRPPLSPRFRRDRPTLERRAGAWLRDFQAAVARPGVPAHLAELAARPPSDRLVRMECPPIKISHSSVPFSFASVRFPFCLEASSQLASFSPYPPTPPMPAKPRKGPPSRRSLVISSDPWMRRPNRGLHRIHPWGKCTRRDLPQFHQPTGPIDLAIFRSQSLIPQMLVLGIACLVDADTATDENELAKLIEDLAEVGLTEMELLLQRDGPAAFPWRLAEWIASPPAPDQEII